MTADCGRSADDLVRAQQQRGRDGEAERLRGLEVDDHFELVRLLDRQFACRGALQDPVDVLFFNDTATTEIYPTRSTLSLHGALPIC